MLAIGDEGLGAVEHIPVSRPERGRPHALQIRSRAGLGHGNGANQFPGRQPRQPAFLLFFGPVMQDVGRNDARMKRSTERIEPRKAVFAIDDRLVRKGATRATVFFRHGGAQETRRTGLGPHFARIHMIVMPLVEVRHELGLHKTPGLLFEQDKVFSHPGRAREFERIHRVPAFESWDNHITLRRHGARGREQPLDLRIAS